MKHLHRVSLAIAAVAALSLSACRRSEEPDDADSAAPQTTAPVAPADTAGTAPEAAPAYASLTGDAVKGEKIFIQCKTCHVTDEGQNRVGPSLHAIIGRTAGQIPGFSYSPANKTSGLVWSEEQLYTYLEAPQKTIPGTKMAFAGLKKPQDRADVIAFLKTKS